MLRSPVRALPILLCLLAPRVPAAPAPGTSPLLENANAIAQHLSATRYVHEHGDATAVVTQGPEGYTVEADCSGWLSYNLRQVPALRRGYAELMEYRGRLQGESRRSYPRANVYEAYFEHLSHAGSAGAPFSAVDSLWDSRPGDILAWCLGRHCEPHAEDAPPAKDTGHVMIVLSPPMARGPRTAFVLVLDSSGVRHWSLEDLPSEVRRAHPELEALYASYPARRAENGGVGVGFIEFTVDDAGHLLDYQFNGSSHPGSARERQARFAIGRPRT